MKTRSHISNTQRTRNTSLFDKAKANQSHAVSTYQASRNAISLLAPNEEFGAWKKTFLQLKDCDVRGPGHEEFETSESHFVFSWIWTSSSQILTSTEDPDLLAAVWVEWCKSQAWAKCYEEEVELIVEEMQRTLVTFKGDACKWERWATSSPLGDPTIDNMTSSGIASYAYKQANIQRKMVGVFIKDWYQTLDEKSLGSSWLDE